MAPYHPSYEYECIIRELAQKGQDFIFLISLSWILQRGSVIATKILRYFIPNLENLKISTDYGLLKMIFDLCQVSVRAHNVTGQINPASSEPIIS